MGVLVLVEHSDGRPDRLSLEALAMARTLEAEWGPLHAVLFEEGPGGAGEAGEAGAAGGAAEAAAVLGALGVSSASLVAHESLIDYAPAAWGAALAQLARERGDRAVVAAGSDRGNEVLAHMAARADLPMVANCTELRAGDPLGITRQRWAGGLLEYCLLDAPVAVVSVAPHAVEPLEVGAGAGGGAGADGPAVSTFEPALADADLVARVVRREAPEAGRLSLADARVVVGGGRGVGGAEGFAALDELAGLLGGAVGVSRAVTSAGWRPHSEQVGQTGVRIAPDVYIACGISGAIQHVVGCKAARQIVVINSDPEAPILERASHAVIGDLRTIVPAISAEIRRTRSG